MLENIENLEDWIIPVSALALLFAAIVWKRVEKFMWHGSNPGLSVNGVDPLKVRKLREENPGMSIAEAAQLIKAQEGNVHTADD